MATEIERLAAVNAANLERQAHELFKGAPKPGEDHMAEANALVNGDRMAAYGSPKPAYDAQALVWSGLLHHKLKEPLTASDVVLLLTGMKLAREARRHKRDNVVDLHGYALVLAHVHSEEGI